MYRSCLKKKMYSIFYDYLKNVVLRASETMIFPVNFEKSCSLN